MDNSKLIKEPIGLYMAEIFKKYKKNEAISFPEGNKKFTYEELEEKIDNTAKVLIGIGIKRGDHIAILSQSSPEYIILLLATVKIGAVLVCINYNACKSELEYVLKQSDSIMIFASEELLEMVTELCPQMIVNSKETKLNENFPLLKAIFTLETLSNLEQDMMNTKSISDETLRKVSSLVTYKDIGTIQYTSGTTGKPKAVMSTHYGIINNAIVSAENFGFNENDRLVLGLPLFHVMGCILTAILILTVGGTLVVIKRFQTKKVLQIIQDEKCTGFNGVPTMYKFMLNYSSDYDVSSLRKGMIAGSYCSPKLMKKIMKDLNMHELSTIYGQTEAMGITQTIISDKKEYRLKTVGKPIYGVEAKICDIETGNELMQGETGELCIRSEYLMLGYYKNEEETNKTVRDGWLHTGDIAQINKDGYIILKDRLKEIIIRGGENISPLEIEETLMQYDKIEDVVVIGVPDNVMGEEIFAYVKPKDNSLTKDEIYSYSLKNLAKYMKPKYIEFINEFPVTSSGKVKKFILKEQAKYKCGISE